MTRELFRLIDGQVIWPYSVAQLRRDEPAYGFSDAPSDEVLARFDVGWATVAEQPEFDASTHRLEPEAPILLEDGEWVREWVEVELSQAEQDAIWRAQNPPEWIAFGNALPAGVRTLLRNARSADEVLGAMLEVGLGKAADGDSRVFIGAWQTAAAAGLVASELAAELIALAEQYHLPAEFIAGLEVPE